MHLIAGLGNPGAKYKNTRHNIGFKIVNLFSRELGISLTGRRFYSRNNRAGLKGKEIILLRPVTFMNLSGKSVKACIDYYQISTGNILIIHDDLDLPVGKIKVVTKGGAGGHRGVQSVSDYLGGGNFPRVKIGIGRPKYGEEIEDYVLSSFYKIEKDDIEEVINNSVQACKLFILKGIADAMNHINGKNLK
ncbi:aminoacyl-tRNA hydrolase [Thermodesulfobacteriota bacterium]